MLGAAAAVMIAAAGPAPEAFCAALATPTASAAPITVRAMLAIDIRHIRWALRPPPGQDCAQIAARPAPDSQAYKALDKVDLVMIGLRYAERHGRRAPSTYLFLEDVAVTATGTVVCEPDARCWFRMLELHDVVYPPDFKNDD